MDIKDARAAYQRGNLQLADMVARDTLAREPGHADAQALIADIATQLDWPAALQRGNGPRMLLIKAWNFGFWSEVDHVLGALLLAELTGRTPLVHWGDNCLFRNADTDNAWEAYFQPVSSLRWADLTQPGLSYFPAKWSADNLHLNEFQKWEGPGSRTAGVLMLNRPEQVLVCDFHTKIKDLLPWIPPGHRLHGLGMHEVYRALARDHLRLTPALQATVDALWQRDMTGRNWLAVHVRGTDKVLELGNLEAVNQLYHQRIDQVLNVNPSLSIFLLTDTASVVEDFRQRWGNRVWTLPVTRGDGPVGVHTRGLPGIALGQQVILDAWLASRCDFFLGNGASNVSTGIRHLRDWPSGTYFLLGPDFLGRSDLSLHTW